MQEKYGFVYIWYDRKHKRYYIGCHWGTEDDGYICSSRWMRQAYKRRPQDFKRRVISRVYTNRADLFEEEYRYLQMIKDEDLGVGYYNLSMTHPNHWSTNSQTHKTVSQKNSETMKQKHQDPEYRAKYLERIKTRDTSWTKDPEIKKKRSRSMKAKMAEKFPVENRPNKFAKRQPNGEFTEAYIMALKKGKRNYFDNWSEEDRLKRSEQAKQRVGFYKANARQGHKNTEEHNKKIGKSNGFAVVIDGIEYYSKCDAARSLGISDGTVNNRIKSDKWPTWSYKQ